MVDRNNSIPDQEKKACLGDSINIQTDVQLRPGIPLEGLNSLICVKNWACVRKLVTFLPLCGSIILFLLETIQRKRVFLHRNTTNQSVKPFLFRKVRGYLNISTCQGVSAWKSELEVHQVADKQNDTLAVWGAGFQASTNTRVCPQADGGCVSNGLAQTAMGRSGAGAALRNRTYAANNN